MNLKLFPKKRQSQFQAVMTAMRRIIHPFTQAMKYSGQDHVIQRHAYPALKTLKDHFREQERSQRDSNPEYALCCSTLLPGMKHRRSKLLDGNLLKAAFWLTSFGRQSL
jgi:hypothetical protein